MIDQLKELLAARHSRDVFVPECKDGPTVMRGGGHRRLDAWAMARSWAHPRIDGYEIKVSTADFRGDDKWQGYLPLCNQLWFVAPLGVIDPAELPGDVGLLVGSRNLRRLHVKKKAAYREIDPPIDLLLYVLMSRVTIEKEYQVRRDADIWREWVENRGELETIGHRASARIQQEIERRVTAAEAANGRLECEIKNLETVQQMCAEIGVNPNGWNVRDQVVAAIEQRNGKKLARDLLCAAGQMERLAGELIGEEPE